MSSVTDLISRLSEKSVPARTPSVDADGAYVEKLASAVQFIVDGVREDTPAPNKQDDGQANTSHGVVLNLGELLRKRVQAKEDASASKKTSEGRQRRSELSELLRRKLADAATTEKDEGPTEDPVASVVEDLFYQEDDSSTEEKNESDASPESSSDTLSEEKAEDSPVEKAASINDMTLAEMIEGAVSGGEGVSDSEESTKTASAVSDERPKAKKEVTSALKSRLLAAVGRG